MSDFKVPDWTVLEQGFERMCQRVKGQSVQDCIEDFTARFSTDLVSGRFDPSAWLSEREYVKACRVYCLIDDDDWVACLMPRERIQQIRPDLISRMPYGSDGTPCQQMVLWRLNPKKYTI